VKASERHRLKQDKFARGIALALAWARRNQQLLIVLLAVLVAGTAVFKSENPADAIRALRKTGTE